MTPEKPLRGRPKSSEPSNTVSTWLPAAEHDKLIKLANKQETSVSSLVRQLLAYKLNR